MNFRTSLIPSGLVLGFQLLTPCLSPMTAGAAQSVGTSGSRTTSGKANSNSQIISNGFLVTVDYDRAAKDMIRVGNFGSADPLISNKLFPPVRHGVAKVEIYLVNFNRHITGDEVLRELSKSGFRPAVVQELLAFGAAHPEQRNFGVCALGSVWNRPVGGRFAPCFDRSSPRLKVYMQEMALGWDSVDRFAAVRK